MDVLVPVLLVLNLLLLLAVLLVVLLRTGGRAGAGAASAAEVRSEIRAVASELRQDLSAQRSELAQSSAALHDRLLSGSRASLQAQHDLRGAVEARFEELREANDSKLEQVRITVGEKLQATLKGSLDENAQRVQALTETHVAKQAELQRTLREELERLRQGNEAKLEKMRETVDEKLQGTLERRLGESFKLVSDRLEQVQKGLGEMQTLASDVGGLKRVLTNVKNRGSWGEVQLSRQLEDMLTREQYEENVIIRPGSRDSVEFAVKLPGRGEDEQPVYLPIDSKFPQEDYERLLEAQERGEKEAIDAAGKTVEKVILTQAKLISEKYIAPPRSTDFAIMYLPTEGLFAEVIRMPGLTSRLQNELRVLVTGPTTLMSLLNSLQMGFRTLAIERRSSEVWQVLSAAKAEFKKYGQVWEKLEKQLQTAQNTVHQAGVRTRAVERQLRSVETLDAVPGQGTPATALGGALEDALPEGEFPEGGTSEDATPESPDTPDGQRDLFADLFPEDGAEDEEHAGRRSAPRESA
ncbi:DNA recombination protein RmuC [Leucobacter massiliensis]|uniref:DNA recombination protein RmuC n=1 Tax=Leucobacter massiliensis TaxID=1686285 RepID=A0A2S9QSW3_9MICO|nr:DNA recombination protein RmuC [Leucobacter massiliensis]PRI12659.1 hypothetical protein B4915_00240 [Leucobacter massiliensis]